MYMYSMCVAYDIVCVVSDDKTMGEMLRSTHTNYVYLHVMCM